MMMIKIKTGGNRKFGYFNEKELRADRSSLTPPAYYRMSVMTIIVANTLRHQFGKPLLVGSAGRTVGYNAGVGGASDSQHLIIRERPCTAIDLHPQDGDVQGLHIAVVKNIVKLKLAGLRGIGFYDWGVHLDTRTKGFAVWGVDENIKLALTDSFKWIQYIF